MKVLFVSSGNNSLNCPIAVNQANSINKYDPSIEIEYFRIKGKGLFGYLKNLKSLKNKLKTYGPDLIHSHYSFSGYLTALTLTTVPIISSLMGSDVQLKGIWKLLLNIFSNKWKKIIVKSEDMKMKCGIKRAVVIPNGADISNFEYIDQETARRKLNLDPKKKYILFLADPNRPEKNYALAKKAFSNLKIENVELITAFNIPFELTVYYYYSCNVVLLTSLYEGSPNVIKEAMACNRPIVTTEVGDVKMLLEGLDNCYVVDHNVDAVQNALFEALKNTNLTKGRDRLLYLGIDSYSIAKKIIDLYRNTLNLPYQGDEKKQICIKGIWDQSIPGISFNEVGVSNYCLLQEKMMRDYPRGELGEKTWELLVTKIKKAGKNRTYDCIVGVSGGVDSSYLMHLCKQEGLRTLAVHFDNGFNSEISVNNIQKITNKLDIDLVTLVVNYEEIKSLFRSYMYASLPWIDAPTDLAIKATMYDMAIKHKVKYIIRGNDFRSEGKQPKEWTYTDSRQLKFVHNKFAQNVKLKTYPQQSFFKMIYSGFFRKIKDVRPFYYIDYNKKEAKKLLMEVYDWKDYGGHHHENLFTKFAMAYWLPKKFNIDKRKINLSAQVLGNAISRVDAINGINQPFDTPENLEELKTYVLKKLNLTNEEFKKIMSATNKNYTAYPSNYNLIYNNIKYFKWIISKLYNYKPMSIDSSEMIK